MKSTSRRSNRKRFFGNNLQRSARSRSAKRRQTLALEHVEARLVLSTTTTCVDVDSTAITGYKGTQDTLLFSIRPDTNFGTDTFVSVDQQDVNGARQGLLKFGEIFTSTGES